MCYADAISCPAVPIHTDTDERYNHNYCGSSWDSADVTCGRACPHGTDAEVRRCCLIRDCLLLE